MDSSGRVWLDAATAEPLLPEARGAWLAATESGWGDPLRLHRGGRLAAQALDQAREVVATAVGARPDEVVFPSSGTHAALAAVAGCVRGRARVGRSVVTSAVDHSTVLAAADAYGSRITVPVDRLGRILPDAWAEAVGQPGVACATVQVANHEVGTLQPYAQAAEDCVRHGVPLILDATAALGRMELRDAGPWSVLTGSAAAFGGPGSVGFSVIRRSARWRPPYPSDDYQDGRWPGPPDVPAIVAAAVALETWLADRETVARRQFHLIADLRVRLAQRIADVDLAGDPDRRAPHLSTFSVLYLDGETLTLELDRAGFAVASGSACSSRSETPSHVLAAMGALTHGNLRVGVTRTTTTEDVTRFLDVLPPIVHRLRGQIGVA